MKALRNFVQFLENFFSLSGAEAARKHISNNLKQFSSYNPIVLDVGCSQGNFLKSLFYSDREPRTISCTIGVDIFAPSLRIAKKAYDHIVWCDARALPFKDCSCNVVIASQIVEHLTKSDGLELISALGRLAKDVLIITVPVAQNSKKSLEDANPWQAHQSSWHPAEFRILGFTVYGYAGARFLVAEKGEFRIKSRIFGPLLLATRFFTHIITRKFVTASSQMFCVKNQKRIHPKDFVN